MRQTQCIGRVKDGKVELMRVGTYCQEGLYQTEKLACMTCGDTEDVVVRLEHIGGRGDEPVPQCRDSKACWARWDRQHGIERSEGEATLTKE